MQMHSVETKAGMAISCAPSRMASFERFARRHVPVDVLDGHRGVIHQDAHRQRQPAQGHEVDRLAQRAENGDGGRAPTAGWKAR